MDIQHGGADALTRGYVLLARGMLGDADLPGDVRPFLQSRRADTSLNGALACRAAVLGVGLCRGEEATDAGLNLRRFHDGRQDAATAARVAIDDANAVVLALEPAPAFFLNGVRYDGPADTDSLIVAIDTALASGRAPHG